MNSDYLLRTCLRSPWPWQTPLQALSTPCGEWCLSSAAPVFGFGNRMKWQTPQRNPQLWYGAGLECWCQGSFSINLQRQFCAQKNNIYKTGVLAALRHINSDTQSWWLLPLVSTFFCVCPMFGQAHAISRAMGHGCMLQYSILRRTRIWPVKIWLWHYHQQEGVHGETQFTSPRPIVVIIQSWYGQPFMSTTSFLGKYAHCNSDFILHVSETSQSIIYFCDRSWSHYI